METTTVLSRYETITTVLSIIAICVSILIPLVQWVYKKWIATAIVKFYPTGQATLFFNQSGSYIRINGVVESERSAATIKKMSIVLTRKRDDRKLNLDWSFLISPVNANLLGNYVQTTEAAHPFRVEADMTGICASPATRMILCTARQRENAAPRPLSPCQTGKNPLLPLRATGRD